MKINFDIDCTPQELRTFFGLPDLEPIQNALLEDMKRRMLDEVENLSPANLKRDWFAPATGMQQALMQMFRPGASSSPAAKEARTQTDSE
jgi:hypothetical protein